MYRLTKNKKEKMEITEENRFLEIIKVTYDLYLKHGARSSKKVIYFHKELKELISSVFEGEEYNVEIEKKVNSYNTSKYKVCDVVVFKKKQIYCIFPVKVIMSNFKQNRNNSWENLTGEITHIIPINIFMDRTPYLYKNKTVKKTEKITSKDIQIYKVLSDKKLCFDVINYIIRVEYILEEQKIKNIKPLGFDEYTKYKTFEMILSRLKSL